MPSLRTEATLPLPSKPVQASTRRLYLSAHLRFIDKQTPPHQLSSHYRALLLDAASSEDDDQMRTAQRVWHFIESLSLTKAEQTLGSCLVPPHGAFWKMVTGYTIRGELIKARDLVSERLREAPDWPSRVASIRLRDGGIDPLAALEHLLTAPPKEEWREWQAACAAWAGCEELDKYDQVRCVMGILAGDADAIVKGAADWEDCFVGSMIFRDGDDIAHIVARMGDQPSYGHIVVNAAKGDYESAIVGVHKLYGEFYSAHLYDILTRGGVVDGMKREWYIFEYGRIIEGIGGCWRIAVDYYSACENGRRRSTQLLERVLVKGCGDPVNEKLYAVCEVLGEGHGVLCKRIAYGCLRCGNYGGAVSWFCRGGFDDLVEEILDDVLVEAECGGVNSEGAMKLAYVITALWRYGSDELRGRLYYGRGYYEMQEAICKTLKDGDEVDEFVSCVRGLLNGGLPRRYWCGVVYEACAMVEKFGTRFDKKVLKDCLNALEIGDKRALQRRFGELEEALLWMRRVLLVGLARS